MNFLDIILYVCEVAIVCYGIYFFYVRKLLFEKKYSDKINEFTPKVMIRARPYRDNTLLSNPDSIKYDVYVLNSFKAFYEYNKLSQNYYNPKTLIKHMNSDKFDSLSSDNAYIDSTFDSLDSAKERAKLLLDKITGPNIYTESAKINFNEIKEFNEKLNKIPENYFSV